MKDIEITIIRHGEPGQYDKFPYGSICKRVKNSSKEFDIYIQLSKKEQDPEWELIGSFNNETKKYLQDEIDRMLSRLPLAS